MGPVQRAPEVRAPLTGRHQDIDVVAAHEVVREADDGALQAGLPVVVRGIRGHKARQLRHLCTSGESLIRVYALGC